MAYMRADGEGPVLHKRGEWLSNVHQDELVRTQRESWASPARCYVGPPLSGPGAYSVARLKSLGMMGLYLSRDEPMPEGAVEVATPESLREQVADEAEGE